MKPRKLALGLRLSTSLAKLSLVVGLAGIALALGGWRAIDVGTVTVYPGPTGFAFVAAAIALFLTTLRSTQRLLLAAAPRRRRRRRSV